MDLSVDNNQSFMNCLKILPIMENNGYLLLNGLFLGNFIFVEIVKECIINWGFI